MFSSTFDEHPDKTMQVPFLHGMISSFLSDAKYIPRIALIFPV